MTKDEHTKLLDIMVDLIGEDHKKYWTLILIISKAVNEYEDNTGNYSQINSILKDLIMCTEFIEKNKDE